MTPERWRLIKEAFNAGLEQDEAARTAWLRRQYAGDESLRNEVESLLAAHEGPPNFIDRPVLEHALDAQPPLTACSWIGRTVGHYRIIEQIGHGGMSAVYRAARVEEHFEHQVAIKLLRQSHDARLLLKRFRAERQILARLSHPNIAHLLDGGSTEDGSPYLVMEYVQGVSIDTHCERCQLSVVSRLRLFRALCDAVHYVHRHLMVHGDIKCSNVLVNEDGIVKLLDFGIAKLLDSAPSLGITQHKPTGFLALTPEYASPEQIRGQTLTTASDVYSLGVVLYKLLTGQLPHFANSGAYYDLATQICETDPQRPSVVAEKRADAPCRAEHLRGDLDNIILKTLHKDPEQRYSSVEQLSQDVGRYLGGFPVMAVAESTQYRVRKFIGRNRALVAAGVLASLSLVAGTVAASWQAHRANRERERAERHFNDVRSLAQTFMVDVHDSLTTLPGATPARRMIIANTLKYLDALAQENSADVEVQLDLARAYERIGNLQDGFQAADLKGTEAALASYTKALDIRNALWASGMRDSALLRERLGSYLLLAQLSQSNRAIEEGWRHSQTAVDLARSLTQQPGAAVEDQRLLANTYVVAGTLAAMNGVVEPGLADLRKAAALYESHIAAGDTPGAMRKSLALTYSRLGGLIAYQAGRHDEAVEAFERSLAVSAEILQLDPRNAEIRKMHAYSQLGAAESLAKLGQSEDALSKRTLAVEDLQELLLAEPDSETYQFDLAWAQGDLSESLHATGDLLAAEAALNEAQQRLQKHPGMQSTRLTATRYLVAINDLRMGQLLSTRAAQPNIPTREHQQLWHRARASFERSTSVFTLALQDPVYSDEAATKKTAAEAGMIECDAQIKQFSASRG